MAHFGKEGVSEMSVPRLSQETLAEMVGTTRSRVSFFMNRFRKLGFINYSSDNMHVHSSLLSIVLNDDSNDDSGTTATSEIESLPIQRNKTLEPPARPGGAADKDRARRPSLDGKAQTTVS
jgi:CRP/FNR family cyclic AMP-dependent transcriptional regulator